MTLGGWVVRFAKLNNNSDMVKQSSNTPHPATKMSRAEKNRDVPFFGYLSHIGCSGGSIPTVRN